MIVTRKIGDSLRRDGLWGTGKRCARAVWNRRRYLIHEPALALRGVPPRADFNRNRTRIAVQIHMYYPQLAEEMIEYTNRIPYRFDCYLSTDTPEKAEEVCRAFQRGSRAAKIEIGVYPNRGRDVAPFIAQLAPVIDNYDYLVHLHTKYSTHDDFGNGWRDYLLESLLASPRHIAAILEEFDRKAEIGLVFQRTYRKLKPYLGWRGNRSMAEKLFQRMGLELPDCKAPQFPVGDMFWARRSAIAPLLECGLTAHHFQEEAGQVEGTLAHCIERCWGCLAQARGYTFLRQYSSPSPGEPNHEE